MGSNLYLKPHQLKTSKLSEVIIPEMPNLDGSALTNTKLIFTIGPSTKSVETLKSMLMAGVVCARFDFTWGLISYHIEALNNLQQAVQETGKQCAVMVDTQGREIYVIDEIKMGENGWPYPKKVYNVKIGDKVIISSNPEGELKKPDQHYMQINYEKYYEQMKPGDVIYVGRYLVTGADAASLYLRVKEIDGTDIVCEAENNAELEQLLTFFHMERAEFGVDCTQNKLPILSEQDKKWIVEFSQHHPIDILSLSYTREGADLEEARDFLTEIGQEHTDIFAKIEQRQALYNFKSILGKSDGIIISRGNLGLDVVPEKVSVAQKHIITFCNMMAKPVMITRIVDTMISAPRPTRAEATDVSNAILDGVDGLILAAETVRGAYPLETVLTVLASCRAAEKVVDSQKHYDFLMQEALKLEESQRLRQTGEKDEDIKELDQQVQTMAHHATYETDKHLSAKSKLPSQNGYGMKEISQLESIASSGVGAASRVNASLLIVFSQTGSTAKFVAKYRPAMPIISLVVPSIRINKRMKYTLQGAQTARQSLVVRGLFPILAEAHLDGEALLDSVIVKSQNQGLIKPYDNVVIISKTRDELTVQIVQAGKDGIMKLPEGLGRKASQIGLIEQDGEDIPFHTLSEVQEQTIDVDKLKAEFDQRQKSLAAA